MSRVNYISLILSLLFVGGIYASPRASIGFAYWDVDRAYDTIPSMFYDDGDFTPKGRYRWNSEKYRCKIDRIAAVVDSMRMPIVALYGVESEDVVRDIVTTLKGDYCYLHRTIDGRDGLDFALLYYGDILFIDYVYTFYGRIYIEGTVLSKRVGIWLTRSGYLQKTASPPYRNSAEVMILAGGFYREDLQKLDVVDHTRSHEKGGQGNAMSQRGWYMRHRVATSCTAEVERSGVYITPWLLSSNGTSPLPTFTKDRYKAGYSAYLPIYLYLSVDIE